MNIDKVQANAEIRSNEGYREFLKNPLVRFMMAQIPGDSDVLLILLESGFKSGFTAGSAHAYISVIESNREPRP